MWRRLTLTRPDGIAYLDRWGWMGSRCSIYLHRMQGPDPGLDLHDHPWTFLTTVLKGGYREQRAETRTAGDPDSWERERRRAWRPRLMRLDEAHQIVELTRTPTWTLVITGPKRRTWGFYEPDGWVRHSDGSKERRPLTPTDNWRAN